MNKEKAKQIRYTLKPVLAELGKQLNCSIILGNGRFSDSNIRFSLEIAEISPEGNPLTKEVTDFKNLARNYNLLPIDLGREFYYSGNRYTIVGLRTSSHKFPILCKRADGKSFRFGASTIKLLLPPPPPVPTELVTFLETPLTLVSR